MVFCRSGDGGDCHQLLRSADVTRGNFGDSADDTAQRSAVLMVAICISDSLRRVVCRWGTNAGCYGDAPRIYVDHVVVVGGLCVARSCDELRILAWSALPLGDG